MNKIKFGPSGNSDWFYEDGNKNTLQAPKWLNSKGLMCYEYSFGRGFTMKQNMAEMIGEEAKKYNIEISVHAPYYINFANTNDDMIEKSINYVIESLKYCKYFKGNKIVIHSASCGKLNRDNALEITKNNLKRLIAVIYENKFDSMFVCLETMGKFAQIGTYEEIINLCCLDKIFLPTFDFGHINALTSGGLKTKEDYKKIFDLSIEKLGYERTKNCHIHFSKIEYGINGGEVRHLTFEDNVYGPNFEPLAEIIKEYKLTPTIICESKNKMAEDAYKMKIIYESIK